MDGSSTPQKDSSSYQSITNKNKHPISTFCKDEPRFKYKNQIFKIQITMTPAHQSIGFVSLYKNLRVLKDKLRL